MNTYLVRPDYEFGGDDNITFVRAEHPEAAIKLVLLHLSDGELEADEMNQHPSVPHEDALLDHFAVWRLPDNIQQREAGCIPWQEMPGTYWVVNTSES